MKVSYPFLFCLLTVLLSCDLHSQDFDWTRIDKDNITSKDSIVRDGYTLLFYNKAPRLKKDVKERMINAFFVECKAQEADRGVIKNFRKGIIVVDPGYNAVAQRWGNLLRLGADHFQKSTATIEKDTRFLMNGIFVLSYQDMVENNSKEVARQAANNGGWDVDFSKTIFSRDSVVKNGYTLLFYVQSPNFDSAVQRRMTDTFFEVYPKQVALYNSQAPKKVLFIVDPTYQGVAAALGNVVRYSPEWFAQNPEDIDVVTHEVMHLAQGYGYDAGVPWLTEGIADYVRYQMGLNNRAANWTMPDFNAAQHYNNAYRITARFLVWLEKNNRKDLVKQLDAALRAKRYSAGTWKTLTGKTVDELWADYAKDPAVELAYQ